jgi:hypothetical protein
MRYAPIVAITVKTSTTTVHTVAPAVTVPVKAKPPALTTAQKTAIDGAVCDYVSKNAPPAEVVDPSTKRIDATTDRAMIHHVYTALATGALSLPEKNYARECFRKRLGC